MEISDPQKNSELRSKQSGKAPIGERAWSPTSDPPNSQNSEVDLVKVSAVVQKAVLVLVLLSAVLMS